MSTVRLRYACARCDMCGAMFRMLAGQQCRTLTSHHPCCCPAFARYLSDMNNPARMRKKTSAREQAAANAWHILLGKVPPYKNAQPSMVTAMGPVVEEIYRSIFQGELPFVLQQVCAHRRQDLVHNTLPGLLTANTTGSARDINHKQ